MLTSNVQQELTQHKDLNNLQMKVTESLFRFFFLSMTLDPIFVGKTRLQMDFIWFVFYVCVC